MRTRRGLRRGLRRVKCLGLREGLQGHEREQRHADHAASIDVAALLVGGNPKRRETHHREHHARRDVREEDPVWVALELDREAHFCLGVVCAGVVCAPVSEAP